MQQIFITSTYRSGVMLLTKSLSVNSKLSISSSTINYFRSYFNNKQYFPLKKKYKDIIENCFQRLKKRQKILINKQMCLKYLKIKGVSHKSLIEVLNNEIHKNFKAEIIGEAETNAWNSIPTFLKMFPESKVIIVVRDPRDILCSFKKLTIAKKNDYLISIFNFLDLVKKIIKYKNLYNKKIIVVKFHEFKTKKEKVLKKICKNLKVKFEKKMLYEKSFRDLKGKKWNSNYSYTFKNRLQKKTIDRWKEIIQKEDLYLCEHILNKEIKYIGLKLSKQKFTKKNIKDAIKKINSSALLKKSYKDWKKNKKGNDKFPLDPLDPKTWRDHKR